MFLRKLIVLNLILFTHLFFPVAVKAASIGEVQTQGKGKLGIGIDQEFLFERKMKVKTITHTFLGGGEEKVKPEIDNMYRTMVKMSYGLLKNLDVYGKLGTADIKARSDLSGTLSAGGTLKGNVKMIGENAFIFGLGIKGTFTFADSWLVGCDAQYLKHRHPYKGSEIVTFYNTAGSIIGEDTDAWNGTLAMQEWQFGTYIAKEFGRVLPYLGFKYSELSANEISRGKKTRIKADTRFGTLLGIEYKVGKYWFLNLEGRFIDETAMSFGTTFKF